MKTSILVHHSPFIVCVMTYKKGNCREFGPVDVFQFKSDSVKPISCTLKWGDFDQ